MISVEKMALLAHQCLGLFRLPCFCCCWANETRADWEGDFSDGRFFGRKHLTIQCHCSKSSSSLSVVVEDILGVETGDGPGQVTEVWRPSLISVFFFSFTYVLLSYLYGLGMVCLKYIRNQFHYAYLRNSTRGYPERSHFAVVLKGFRTSPSVA